jgi:hypothetical protein
MFIQVLRAKVKDADAVKAAGDRWQTELKPGAKGYLGSTAGIADDGTYVVFVRFASEADARANSERPEQTTWTAENSKHFDGEITFYDCPDADMLGPGGSDDAGFVQVMFYRPTDVGAIRKLAAVDEQIAAVRPDLIGATTAYATDGTVIQANYFTSESAAREGEKTELPAELEKSMAEFQANAGEIEFIDIREPQLDSA